MVALESVASITSAYFAPNTFHKNSQKSKFWKDLKKEFQKLNSKKVNFFENSEVKFENLKQVKKFKI